MTLNQSLQASRRQRLRLGRLLLALPILIGAWLAVLALVLRLGGDAPAALVLFPPADLMAHLPPGTGITARGPISVTLKGPPGLVARLYAAGAPLVLPAGLTACLAWAG